MVALVGCGKHPVRVGSKSFTESVILAEMARQLAEHGGITCEHVRNVGGTRLLWEALRAGQIDLYPDYTGTLIKEIFAGDAINGIAELKAKLADDDLKMSAPLGFNNTYVIGMKRDKAEKLGIHAISDLRDHPNLTMRFSNEFMQRSDGWPALARTYNLPQADVRGIEHALAYEAIDQGTIDVTDLYATDAKIRTLDLVSLEDDLAYFPRYDAVFVYRADLAKRAPKLVTALHVLEGAIDESKMIELNAAVEIDHLSEARAAADCLDPLVQGEVTVHEESDAARVWRNTLEHTQMVAVSLGAAILVAIPLGIIAARRARLAQVILGVVGIIQTIPSIALLVMLIGPLKYVSNSIGYPQAVVALFLYSLLPIVRNTYTGMHNIAPSLQESAVALGLPSFARLWRIELPMASRTILAGIKTAAVINVGFATLGGFIGAGGYGEPIFEGIRLMNYHIIFLGAVPAAVLALLVQGLFEIAERWFVPKGLRLKRAE
jgi:osmoprotectant transport system permease protein